MPCSSALQLVQRGCYGAMCNGLGGIKCQHGMDVSKCTCIVVAADHLGDVAIHRHSYIKNDTMQRDVTEWLHRPSCIGTACHRKLFLLRSSAEPTALVLDG